MRCKSASTLPRAPSQIASADSACASATSRFTGTREYLFKHALTQEVAYNSQLGDQRARIHGAVARAIEALHPDGLEAFFKALRNAGIPQADIDLMSKTNPAKVLGLD